MLKTDLHLHTSEDKHHKLKYTAKKLIEVAAKKGFEVLAITNHEHLFFSKKLSDYAKKKGVLLIPGVERYIKGKEVLIYNITVKECLKINTFEDLKELRKKRKDILIIAPHPYFKLGNCLGGKLEQNIDLFDAIELSHFYTKRIDFNKKAKETAKKYNKPMIGTSDAHSLKQLEMTYTMIDSKKNIKSLFEAIKKNKVKIKTKPVTIKYLVTKATKVVFKLE